MNRPGPSRRDMLAAFLGLPAAIAGCRQRHEPGGMAGDLAGEIVGESVDVGHKIRDGSVRAAPAESFVETDVAIVGGGVAGLAAARGLLAAGIKRFVVLELEHFAGGTARGQASGGQAFPWGAHYVPAPTADNRALASLFDEMGLLEGYDDAGEPIVAEQFLCRDPEERLFYKGAWYEGLYLRAGATEEDLDQLRRFNIEMDRWAGWRDAAGRRAFTLPLSRGSDDAEVTALDRQTFAEWLDRAGFASWRLRWLADYACRDDYGLTLEQTSAWAGLFYFASRVRRPGAAPQPLVTWPEGNFRLVEHLRHRCAEQFRAGVAVTWLRPASAAETAEPRWEAIAWDRRGGRAVGFRARRVIFAAPQFVAARVIAPWAESPPPHLGAFEYGSWVVANVHLRDRPASRGFSAAWDNVLYESPSLGYVSATHQLGRDRGPTVWTYYYPLCDGNPVAARRRLLETDWSDWADIVLTDLSRPHHDLREYVERLDAMRWGHAMIRPRPGFIWGPHRRRAAEPDRGLHFAHTDLSGVALFEEAFDHGLRAAAEVAAALAATGSAPAEVAAALAASGRAAP